MADFEHNDESIFSINVLIKVFHEKSLFNPSYIVLASYQKTKNFFKIKTFKVIRWQFVLKFKVKTYRIEKNVGGFYVSVDHMQLLLQKNKSAHRLENIFYEMKFHP